MSDDNIIIIANIWSKRSILKVPELIRIIRKRLIIAMMKAMASDLNHEIGRQHFVLTELRDSESSP